MKKKIQNTNEITLEKIKGWFNIKTAIISGLFLLLVTAITVFFSKGTNQPIDNNSITIKENKNSPVANNIENQTNFYVDTQIKAAPTYYPKQADYKSAPKTTEKSKSSETETTIHAENALIVTNGQSGGSNTVNVNQVPKPTIQLVKVAFTNFVAKEIYTSRSYRKTKLPDEDYQYDSLYKSQFTLRYYCPVTLNSIAFLLKRDDIVLYDVEHEGTSFPGFTAHKKTNQPIYYLSQPENGDYTFTIYSVTKFTDPAKELQMIE